MNVNMLEKWDDFKNLIDTREPEGFFLYVDNREVYVAVDNSTRDAWCEEFDTKQEAIDWLLGRDIRLDLDKRAIYKKAMELLGEESQINMVFEEVSELQKELCKYRRGKKNKQEIAEEIADVEIMLEQMKQHFGSESLVNLIKLKKLERLSKKLELEVR